MRTRNILLIAALFITLFTVSCKKDDAPQPAIPSVTTGLYILSEGVFNANNTTLTYYNFNTKTASTDFFSQVNGSSLGDTGNDLLLYGGKIYIVNTTDFSQTSSNFITDGTIIKFPYGLNVDNASGDVYVTDAKDYISSGEVFCFDNTGKKKFSFSVSPGLNPNTVVLIKQ